VRKEKERMCSSVINVILFIERKGVIDRFIFYIEDIFSSKDCVYVVNPQ
jgi:hypothetical protein